MKTPSPIVTFDNVSFRYSHGLPTVLHNVSFELPDRSFTAIVGPSGGGKSTILRLAAELCEPSTGEVKSRARARMIFQNAALLPWRTVLENVRLGFTGLSLSAHEEKKRALAELAELGIRDFAKQYPRDLSGGQRQRVGIARALVSEPELLLLDEPFSALDVETTKKLSEELLQIYEERAITMLMVSHSIEDAVVLADEILVCAHNRLEKRIAIDLPRPRRAGSPEVEALVKEVRAAIS
jgi:NitT/TauT family transport system ATP-binding protein